jgi:pyroglutamyl-peptidase
LSAATQWTEISDDAGNYVCNDLYYRVLAYIEQYQLSMRCLFIHVPPLNAYNCEPVAHDFAVMLARLADTPVSSALKAA